MVNTPDFSKRLTKEEKVLVRSIARISKQNSQRKGAGNMQKELKMRPQLFKHFKGKCFWCDIDTIFLSQVGKAPSNMATVDHVRSRFFRKKGEETLKVLACYRCNQLRAKREIMYLKKTKPALKTGECDSSRTSISLAGSFPA